MKGYDDSYPICRLRGVVNGPVGGIVRTHSTRFVVELYWRDERTKSGHCRRSVARRFRQDEDVGGGKFMGCMVV